MPKIIFTSHCMRDAPPTQLTNYVKYIGTREGVEKIDESKLELSATMNQKNLIKQLIDLLSYISLHPQNWRSSSYVALNGVSEQPILKLLELYPQLQGVTLCLDNDEAGLNKL